MLVNSSSGKRLNHCKPSASHFNHAVVRVVMAGKGYYFDPTIGKQAGNFEHSAQLDLGYALNLTAAGEDLVALPFDLTRKIFTIKHCVDLSDSNKVTVTVRRTHFALMADKQRFYIGSTEMREVQNDYFERAEADINVGLKVLKPFAVVKDDLETNTLITEEVYEITDLENVDENSKVRVTTNFHRSFPYPYDERFELQTTAMGSLVHEIEVLFPGDIDSEFRSHSIANPCFEYSNIIRAEGRSLKINTRVNQLREVVDHDEIEQYYIDARCLYDRRHNRFKVHRNSKVASTGKDEVSFPWVLFPWVSSPWAVFIPLLQALATTAFFMFIHALL